jgi:hypothetical protein
MTNPNTEHSDVKKKHADYFAMEARMTLEMLKIRIGQDFHSLKTSQVDALLVEADRVNYQRPRNTNGSRARYFHDLLQRRAKG